MARSPRFGGKIRALRRREGLTQARLAEQLGISASYLNLIEHDKRPLPAHLLIALAKLFDVAVDAFAAEEDARLEADLMEVLGDDLFEPYDLSNAEVRDVVSASPSLARAVVGLFRAWSEAKEQASLVAEATVGELDPATTPHQSPSEQVSDFIQRNHNHFPSLEAAAEALWTEAHLHSQDLASGLTRHLEVLGIEVRTAVTGSLGNAVRRFDAATRVLTLSEVLPPRTRRFQLAHVVALRSLASGLDRLVDDPLLTSRDARILARIALASYFAGAVLMPYRPFLDAARELRYDIELLGHRFRASFEQVCHRLTTLRRPGESGVAFHLIRIDLAGNLSKKFSGNSMRFPRFSGLCPKWNVFPTLLSPETIRVQVSRLSRQRAYFTVARTLRRGSGGWKGTPVVHAIEIGCELEDAGELVYSDGVDLHATEVPVGITCRLCQRQTCEQRAQPSIYHPADIDENVRARAFYVAVE